MRGALAAKPSLEARRRLEAITGRLRGLWHKPDPERLRTLRALELWGTAEAREVLSSLAKGAVGAPVTERAKAALGRIGKGS